MYLILLTQTNVRFITWVRKTKSIQLRPRFVSMQAQFKISVLLHQCSRPYSN